MDFSSQIKVLRQLARTPGEAADEALSKEMNAIALKLQSAAQYDQLEQQLELLNEIGFREAGKCVQIMQDFLNRIEVLELIHDSDDKMSAGYVRKFQTKERLLVKALGVLDRIRYLRTSEIVEIFAKYTDNLDDDIGKKASEGLKHLAQFDIDIYYAGENRAGLGPAPQLQIMKWLEALSAKDLSRNFAAVSQLCGDLLSSKMSATSADYQTVTLSTAAIPATKDIREIRERSLVLLRKLYSKASAIDEKKSVINSMLNATYTPRVEHGDDIVRIVSSNTVKILNFFMSIILDEDLQIVQKIEHETFWRFYHAPTKEVKSAALEIRDVLNDNREYKIYRDLIGFEGVIGDWEERLSNRRDFSAEKEHRASKAIEYADEIVDANWGEWRERILRFCQTQSNDLATFPHFYEFLYRLTAKAPEYALELLKNHRDEISPFIIPMFRGLWNSTRRNEFREQILEWIGADQWLVAIAKLFIFNEVDDEEILEILTKKAIQESLHDVLVMLTNVATAKYADDQEKVAHSVFLPAVDKLTDLGSANWIFDFWYRDDRKSLLADLDESGREVVLDNLILAKEIDYHVEDLLIPFAETDPARVLDFFRDRQAFEQEAKKLGDYDAIPYDFHNLNGTLARFPDIAVDTVRTWFDGRDALFQYRGANLLKIIFPEFPEEFSSRLIALVHTHEKEDVEFVLSVLRNYEGQMFLYDTCREIVLAFPEDKDVLCGVQMVLRRTGVVSGEFGFAAAYEGKIEQIKKWLSDDHEPVRKFASQFAEKLKLDSENERRRAEERIELRKHMYGVREGSEKDSDSRS